MYFRGKKPALSERKDETAVLIVVEYIFLLKAHLFHEQGS
jgi:hypothetical protein